MPRPPTLTLLLIDRDLLVRADFAGIEPAGLWPQKRPAVDEFGLLVEAAVNLGPRPARKIWVLSSDLWTQTLSVPLVKVDRLTDSDLAQALAFEVEELSGVPGLESVLAPVRMVDEGGQRTFWISQAPLEQLHQAEDAVQRAGGRLVGLCHPAGLPSSLAVAGDAAWQRVELWPDAVVLLHGEPGKPPAVHVINTDPNHDRWHGEEENWRNRHRITARREMRLVNGDILGFGPAREPQFQVEGQEALRVWLGAWARCVSTRQLPVPVLRPAPKPMAKPVRGLIAASLALLMLAACVFHRSDTLAEIKKLEMRQAGDQQRRQGRDQAAAQVAKNLMDTESLKKEMDALKDKFETCKNILEAHELRQARLLTLLSENRPDDHLVVRKIEPDGEVLKVQGICLRSELANQYARRLHEKSPRMYLEVLPAKIKACVLPNGDAGWEFELRIRDQAPRNLAPPVSSQPVEIFQP